MYIFTTDYQYALGPSGWVHISRSSSGWTRFTFDEALEAAEGLGEVIIQGI
jgi:hypothetical protein